MKKIKIKEVWGAHLRPTFTKRKGHLPCIKKKKKKKQGAVRLVLEKRPNDLFFSFFFWERGSASSSYFSLKIFYKKFLIYEDLTVRS
jgi:hypothetical protein